MLEFGKHTLGRDLQATYVWHNHAHPWKACFKDLYLQQTKSPGIFARGLSLLTNMSCTHCNAI